MRHDNGDTYWARIFDHAWDDWERLALARTMTVDGKRATQRARIVWETVEEGAMLTNDDACLTGRAGEITGLLLAALGKKANTPQEMDAVQAHLQDMRRLVFKGEKP